MADEQTATPTDAPATEARPEQTVTIEDAGPARKKLTIELPESRIKEKIESTYTTLRNDAAVPGFRRGRAPRRLIERRFGSSIQQDVKSQLLTEAYTQAVEDHNLDVLGEPEVKDLDKLALPESGPLTFSVEIEVSPEVKLPSFDTLEVKKVKREVTDQTVETELERYRQQLGKMTAVEDTEVREGDYVLSHTTVLAGHGVGEDAEVILDNPGAYILVNGEDKGFKGHVLGILIDDLGKRLIGKAVGHEEVVEMTGPGGHEHERIQNQPITLKVRVERVERLEPAAMEQVVTATGAASEEELRQRVRESLEQRAEREQKADLYRQLSEQLVDKVELELPEGITARQAGRVLHRRALELQYQGVAQQEIESQLAELRSGSQAEAVRQLKQFFVIDQASKELDVEVSESEINGRIAMMAMQQGRRPEKLRQDMQRQGQIEQLYLQIREQKTLDKVLESAKVTEVEASEAEADAPAKTTKKKTTKKSATTKKKPSAKEQEPGDQG